MRLSEFSAVLDYLLTHQNPFGSLRIGCPRLVVGICQPKAHHRARHCPYSLFSLAGTVSRRKPLSETTRAPVQFRLRSLLVQSASVCIPAAPVGKQPVEFGIVFATPSNST